MSVLRSARARGLVVAVSLVVGLPGIQPVLGQSTTVMGFIPGARTIANLDFAGTAIGEFPTGLKLLQGSMEVVDKNGMHMLRASSPSEFVLQLPEALPPKFTLEFELIPKTCCNPVDLMVEGVISGSRSSVSAQLEWHPGHFAVVGGNPTMFQMDMPVAIAATLPAQLTQVAVSFDDETVKMYTNGRRLYTLSDRKFVRGRVLRISLGGQDDDKYAVYLARVRVADAATTSTVASSQSAITGSGLTNTLNGATLTTAGGGAVPVPVSSAPTSTTVAAPSGPGTTAGPLPAGTVSPTSAQTAATQPAALSSPTNPLPTVTTGTTAQQQNAAQAQQTAFTSATATAPIAAATGPVSYSTRLAGPSEFYANLWGANTGWGVVLKWSPVSGATSYRVSRTGPGVPATPITVINLPFALGAGTWVYAVDADVDQTTDYTYWVEGVTVSGALTNPSPVSSVRTGTPPTVMNLRASVAGTTQVQVPGSFAAGSGQGSTVTWTWDALPLVYSYEISYQLVGTAGQFRKTLFTTVTPNPTISPISFGVPQGATVYFCVSVWGSNDPLKSLPTSSSCLTTQVP